MFEINLEIVKKVLALGIWPSLPVIGQWLTTFSREKNGFATLPWMARFPLITMVGLVVWSFPLLVSASIRLYQPWFFGSIGWLITLIFFVSIIKSHPLSKFSRLSMKLGVVHAIFFIGLLFAAILYSGFPTESVWGERDEGVYANHAIYTAQHGRLDVAYPYSAEEMKSIHLFRRGGKIYLPGFYATSPNITVQFGQIYPLWLAQTYASFGYAGMFRFNSIVALLFLLLFYSVCRLVLSDRYAAIATLLLAFNPAQIWTTRITLTEILTQLSIWGGIYLTAIAILRKDSHAAGWGGALLAFAAFVRIDSFLLLPLLLASHAMVHLALDSKEGDDYKKIWLSLYKSYIPIFIIAFFHYILFSGHYFEDLFFLIKRVGLVSICSGALLFFATVTRFAPILKRLLFNESSVRIFGILLLLLFVFAYWVRPYLPPHYYTDPAVSNFLKQSYRENSLIDLAAYLSLPVLVLGVVGWFLAMSAFLRDRKDIFLTILMLITIGYSVVYIFDPSISAGHFYAVRRFVPITIPAIILFAVISFSDLLSSLPSRWVNFLSAVSYVFLVVFLVQADKLIVFFAEDKGYVEQIRGLAKLLPADADVLVDGDLSWPTSLYLIHGRKIIPVSLSKTRRLDLLLQWIEKRIRSGKSVYLLRGESLRTMDHIQEISRTVLSRAGPEAVIQPLPKQIHTKQWSIFLYQIKKVPQPEEYLKVQLGGELVIGVKEKGFHNQEISDGIPFRWTDGTAQLKFPVDHAHRPNGLKINLWTHRKSKVQILVNHIPILNTVSEGLIQGVVPLPAVATSNQFITVDILSNSYWVPDFLTGRRLGVLVNGLQFIDHYGRLSSDPLPEGAYRSSLELITPESKSFSVDGSKKLLLRLSNEGCCLWPSSNELGKKSGAVRVGIIWTSGDDINDRVAEDRVELPYTIYPNETILLESIVHAVGYNKQKLPAGNYCLWISMLQEGAAWFYSKQDRSLKLKVYVP